MRMEKLRKNGRGMAKKILNETPKLMAMAMLKLMTR